MKEYKTIYYEPTAVGRKPIEDSLNESAKEGWVLTFVNHLLTGCTLFILEKDASTEEPPAAKELTPEEDKAPPQLIPTPPSTSQKIGKTWSPSKGTIEPAQVKE